MLMNQTIKSGDGVEYSMTKLCVCGGGGGWFWVLYNFISQTMSHVIE